MSSNGCEISYALRCAVITCRSLYNSTFIDIERKTGVKERTAANIYKKAVTDAGNEDFNDLLNHCTDKPREGRPTRIPNGSAKSAEIREAMLKHSNLQPYTAVFDQENIEVPGQKRPSRSLIERVQHEHQHTSQHTSSKGEEVGELVRVRMAKKPRTNADEASHRKDFCKWALKELEEGAIFICTDETYHQVGDKIAPGTNCTRPKGAAAEYYSVPQDSIEFTIMQWVSMSTEVHMGPLHNWKAKTEKEKTESDAARAVENQRIRENIAQLRKDAEVPGTEAWRKFTVGDFH